MSQSQHEHSDHRGAATRGGLTKLYWVIGGCYGDESRSWRRWSEVVGPFARREAAEAQQAKLAEIFARDARVHFDVVRSDETEDG